MEMSIGKPDKVKTNNENNNVTTDSEPTITKGKKHLCMGLCATAVTTVGKL
jgi:hypothetical protein